MVIRFNKTMTQMYRAVAPLVDPLVEQGDDLVIQVSDRRVDFEKHTHDHHDIRLSSQESLPRMVKNFGLVVRHLNCVRYTRKDIEAELYLNRVCSRINKTLPPHTIGIPFHGHECITPGGPLLTGNPLSEAVRKAPYDEIKGRVLILHIGGARGYVSKRGTKTKESVVAANNEMVMREILRGLEFASGVVVKAHPCPYHGCTRGDMENQLADTGAEFVDDEMVKHVKQAEYVLGFGTSAWNLLSGSGKKLIDVLGASLFDDNRERRFGKGSTPVDVGRLWSLPTMVGTKSWYNKELFDMDAVENIMSIIKRRELW